MIVTYKENQSYKFDNNETYIWYIYKYDYMWNYVFILHKMRISLLNICVRNTIIGSQKI